MGTPNPGIPNGTPDPGAAQWDPKMAFFVKKIKNIVHFFGSTHWGVPEYGVPIGDPRVGVPIGVAPGQGLWGPWPLGPPKASLALGTWASGTP